MTSIWWQMYGKTQWYPDWKSSGASEIDWLLHYDGEINDDDIDVPNRNFGWTD